MIFTRIFSFLFLFLLLLSCDEDPFTKKKKINPLLKSEEIKKAILVQNAIREIYKMTNPSVVSITTEKIVNTSPFFRDPFFRHFFGDPKKDKQKKRKNQGLGSGFLMDQEGYIVTNHHVIDNVDSINVKFVDGSDHEATLIGSDKYSDIALLKVDSKKKFSYLSIGNSDDIRVGDMAIAIGNPFGLSSTLTTGVISSVNQEIESSDGRPRIQTDAAINPGNSGGPLLNVKGEVIGINQMIYTKSGGSLGIGFAIPINHAMSIILQLKEGKKIEVGYIGVNIVTDPPREQLYRLGLLDQKGLLIAMVQKNSPAWKTGIRTFDFITHIDDKLADRFYVLKSTILQKKIGDYVKLRIIRNGSVKSFNVKIGKQTS